MFPAQAGVIPEQEAVEAELKHVPRAGGGDPWTHVHNETAKACSPRRRG